MNNETRRAIEAYLKEQGYIKKYGHEIFFKGLNPNQRIVDLETEPPFVGVHISADKGRVEAESEECSIDEMKAIKIEVLRIYNEKESFKPVFPIAKEDIQGVTTPGTAPKVEKKSSLKIITDDQIYHDPKDAPKKDEVNVMPTEKNESKDKPCYICEKGVDNERVLYCVTEGLQVTCRDCGDVAKRAPEPKEEQPKIPPNQEKNRRTGNMPESNTPAIIYTNVPAKKSDQELDEMIEKAKAAKYLANQGSSYTVSGKNRPDSAMVQKFANTADISTEILTAEQTKEYAHVVVRGHRGNKYIDAVVHHDYETEFQLMTMEILKKNPRILDHFEGSTPIIVDGATIEVGGKVVDAKYHLIHALLNFKTFSLRDATTKAMNIVQMKLLNQDSRSDDEIASEQKERDMVEDSRKQKGR